MEERVFGLDGGDRLNGVRTANGFGTRFGQTEMQNLAFSDKVLDRATSSIGTLGSTRCW